MLDNLEKARQEKNISLVSMATVLKENGQKVM